MRHAGLVDLRSTRSRGAHSGALRKTIQPRPIPGKSERESHGSSHAKWTTMELFKPAGINLVTGSPKIGLGDRRI